MTTRHTVLHRETAHLPQNDRDLIDRRLFVACLLVSAFPTSPEQALTDKLQSFGDVPRWACVLIARAALETRPALPAVAAAA